jgi:uncharacterized OB-fold protein
LQHQSNAVTQSEQALSELWFELPIGPVSYFVPERGLDTDFFWTSGADGKLRLITCADCGYITHPPGPRCARCMSVNVAPVPVSGRGSLFAWTVSVQAFMPGLDPYCVAQVQLDEQDDLHLTTQVVDVGVHELRVGLPVEVLFVSGPQDIFLPFFRPVRP